MTLASATNLESEELALGRLRESLAALINAERLCRSRSVGPKVLTPLFGDLRTELGAFAENAEKLSVLVERAFGPRPELGELGRRIVETFAPLAAALDAAKEGPHQAAPRLRVERQLEGALPLARAATDHFELLLESAHAQGVEVEFRELLRSDAEAHPPGHLELYVATAAEPASVRLPARPVLRALALLLGTLSSPLEFEMELTENSIVLRRGSARSRDSFERFVLAAPRSSPVSEAVAKTVLGTFGIAFDDDGGTVRFPRA